MYAIQDVESTACGFCAIHHMCHTHHMVTLKLLAHAAVNIDVMHQAKDIDVIGNDITKGM